MSDRKLTEAAARGAGYTKDGLYPQGFNPLTDGNDALSLVVMLQMELSVGASVATVRLNGEVFSEHARDHAGSVYAAACRAIVRAAAEQDSSD